MIGEMKEMGEPINEGRLSIVDGGILPGKVRRIVNSDLLALLPNITLQRERPLAESRERKNPSGIPDL